MILGSTANPGNTYRRFVHNRVDRCHVHNRVDRNYCFMILGVSRPFFGQSRLSLHPSSKVARLVPNLSGGFSVIMMTTWLVLASACAIGMAIVIRSRNRLATQNAYGLIGVARRAYQSPSSCERVPRAGGTSGELPWCSVPYKENISRRWSEYDFRTNTRESCQYQGMISPTKLGQNRTI